VQSDDGTTVAEFAPVAGMVCCSFRWQEQELLDARKGLEAYAGQGSTMGIPLLYPWANRLANFDFDVAGKRVELPRDPARIHQDAQGPRHGVTPSLMRWSARAEAEDVLTAELAWHHPELLELFPFAHSVAITATVQAGKLELTTTVSADGDDHVPVCFGFHPYLRLGEGCRPGFQVILPPCCQLTLDDRMLPTGERVPADNAPAPIQLSEHAFDDAYELTSDTGLFVASSPRRRLEAELLEGYRFAQIYSPADAEFICLEPMTAPTNALITGDSLTILAPGEEHRASFRIAFAESGYSVS
jgi:galactose mutarotase-like enzyme